MNKKFYIWSDPNCQGVDPVWEEIDGKAFYALLQDPANAGRRFIRLGNDVDRQDTVITIEATPEEYRAWMAEERRKSRRRKDNREMDLVPLEDNGEEDELLLSDRQTAESMEDWVLDSVLQGQLIEALKKLNEAEQAVLELLYARGLSMRDAAKALGVSHTTVQWRQNEALKKLRREFR